MQAAAFTIGHSNHTQEYFAELLRRHGMNVVCDVRSQPYSRINPQFNREDLRESLRAHGIRYIFLGSELGARSELPSCYVNGRVQYDRLAKTARFCSGIDRVLNGASSHRLALMCAEKEPLECHRAILVSRRLVERGLEIQHIHADGHLESHASAISRLIQKLGIPEMFLSFEEVCAEAYRLQSEAIAYSMPEAEETSASASPRIA